jgi:Transcriptional activator of glycolytic enzymes
VHIRLLPPPEYSPYWCRRPCFPRDSQAQQNATFPILAELRAAVGTPAFPTEDVCYATRDFIALLAHFATVLWQDLAVMWLDMEDNIVFTQHPFADNSVGWVEFRDKARAFVAACPSPALSIEAELARQRGDVRQAAVLEVVARECSGAGGAHARDTHRLVASLAASAAAATSLSTLPQAALTALRVERAAATRQAEEAGAAAAEALAAEAAINLKDPRSWPKVGPNETLPKFASSYEFESVISPQEVADEFLRGAEGKPAVRDLEEAYGPSIRTGSKLTGSSYRSRKVDPRGTQRKDNAFSKRKLAYDIIESEGEEGVTRLEAMVTAKFGSDAQATTGQMEWLFRALTSERDGFEKRSQNAKEGAKKRARKVG